MRVVMFCHSIVSCWNHGNAHFLRGVAAGLLARGHEVRIYEPENGWSRGNLVRDFGPGVLDEFRAAYPCLHSQTYDPGTLDPGRVLEGADLVLVHEWNDPDLVARIGEHRAERGEYVLLFHDTHHRSVSDSEAMARYDLRNYDGVLAFGNAIRDIYLQRGWARRAWTWHEAADTRVFRPLLPGPHEGDLVWIGNWGDDERTAELDEFIIGPVRRLGLRARFYGVRYPQGALDALAAAGIEYGGWLPNFRVPEVFARFLVTVHVPRRYYAGTLPGIPTIRVFEALACGIPLVSAPWDDAEKLFTAGEDYLAARDGTEMTRALAAVLGSPSLARRISTRGLATIRTRHTCAHRVEELLNIYRQTVAGSEVAA